jgi:RNA polymerase sigma-70 factor (ECF subfamily)
LSIDIDALYQRYGPMVHRRCKAMLHDEELAMDATQDVFVELLRRGEKLQVSSPSSFLYRAATNVCLNRIRSSKRKPMDFDPELVERIARAPIAEERSLGRALLDRIFQREEPSTRAMAVMHLVDGMTIPEVAAVYSMSESGVRKRLRVLKQHVRELQEVA